MGGQISSPRSTNLVPQPPSCKDVLSFVFDDRPSQYEEQRPIYIDAQNPSWTLNAKQFRKLVRLLIAGFKANGLQKGDCVLVHLSNQVLYSAIFYSIIGAEGIYMGTNPRCQTYELQHLLQQVQPKVIVTSPDGLATVQKAVITKASQVCVLDDFSVVKLSKLLVSRPTTPAESITQNNKFEGDVVKFSSLLDHGECDWVRFDNQYLAESTPAAMFTTSGTGGLPKAAILSHHAIVMHHLSIHYEVPYDVTRLMSLPMFHLFGALWTHIFPIRYGQPLYVLPRFDLEQFVQCVYIYRITETYMVPAMVQALNRYSSLSLNEFLTSLRYVGVAGESIDGASIERFQAKLHAEAQMSQLWGMTEIGVGLQTRYGVHNDPASIGRLLPNSEVKLVDNDGNTITHDDKVGELHIRGPGTLIGYKGMTSETAKDEDGWFRTGDIMCTRNGNFYIVGRAKELIKVNGWQVAPAELEGVLHQHPEVADAAVIGTQQHDSRNKSQNPAIVNEAVRAFIVPRYGCTPTADSIYQFARERLASYKAITGGIVFVEEIPRTASGKIQRFKLSQMNSYRDMMASLMVGRRVGSQVNGSRGTIENISGEVVG
ncbi:hypothetical protein AJ79_06561 [Helicocarpus griseus UAMH5409]|uniref:AMP-dependent synthetase/ligase domain-containing protein n=1 Tax=Helicocarpus griseus UAMH5409 TaxID=1447875 RepID=A0A2B7XCD5_9EURO|nr:hypothetical protein AJ79_06561 [Helicocarpus griseus UAMH5409]